MTSTVHPPRKTVKKTAPPQVSQLLQPEEKILRIASIHPGIYWKAAAVGLMAVPLLLSPFLFRLGVLLAVVAAIMATLATLYRGALMLVLTDKRVFLRHGILRVDMVQIRHSRIESVETERTIMGQILGYATVVITGTGSRVSAIPYIADALPFRNELDDMISRYEERGLAPPQQK